MCGYKHARPVDHQLESHDNTEIITIL